MSGVGDACWKRRSWHHMVKLSWVQCWVHSHEALQPPPRPPGKINQLNCRKCMKSQRVLEERESGRTSVEPLCLCSKCQLYTEDGVHGREGQQEAAHRDCIFQALTFFLLIHRGITQGQGHASDSAFLRKTFLLWWICAVAYIQWIICNYLLYYYKICDLKSSF